MINIKPSYQTSESQLSLFLKQAYNPLIFSNTDSKVRNIANAAISLATTFTLSVASFGLFTLFTLLTVYKYGESGAVHIEDEIDKITSLVNVKRLKEAAKESIDKIENEKKDIDYHSIYLLAVMMQKGIVPKEMDLQQTFAFLSTVSFPDQEKAALRCASLSLNELIDLAEKPVVSENEMTRRSELLEEYEAALDVMKNSQGLSGSNFYRKAIEKGYSNLSSLSFSGQWKISLRMGDLLLNDLVNLDKKSQLNEQEKERRIKLLEKYEASLETAKEVLVRIENRTETENQALGKVYRKQFEVKWAEGIEDFTSAELLRKAIKLEGSKDAFKYLDWMREEYPQFVS